MAYEKFKPIIWSQFIQRELEKKCRLVEDCWKKFEGEVKHGKTVKILGVGSPTIGTYTGASIGSPEVVEGTEVNLNIDQAKFFNFMVDDVDRAQSVPGLMETLIEEATAKMAQNRDSYVAGLAAEAENKVEGGEISTPEEAKKALDEALLKLRENDVDLEDEVVIEVAPFFYQLLRDNLAALKTNNDELVAKGVVGMYDNCRVKLSNNLYNDGTETYMMVRTKRAIAFAGQIDEVEAYRPQDLFSDAMKGLNVYGAKIVRQKEIVALKGHKAA
ncbi:MAG: hypothetical protein IJN42_01765 [Clostridia bacterium]|nr:hypothetical protein [Clostridia bacterium]